MTWMTLAVIAIACGWLGTRLARDAAARYGLVDRPDGRRKMQTRAIPLAGGLGVLFGASAALLIAFAVSPSLAEELKIQRRFLVCLGAAATIIAVVGVLDDRFNLRARYKILGQLLAAFILVFPGRLLIESVALFGQSVELGLLSVPFTFFWFLAAINALNLLDGMDGLLGTVSVIVFAALGAMAFSIDQTVTGWVSIAMAGALIGFLRYNLPPATVYLGDCGSMLIGLVVAAVAIKSTLKGPAVALVAPMAILVLPIMDTAAAIIRRKLTGRGLAIADRGHLHHVLQRNGLSIRRSLILVAVLGGIAAGGALFSTYLNNDLFALCSAASVVLILFMGGLFGNAEFRLVRERTVAVLKRATGRRPHIETAVRLQGDAAWDDVWKDVTACAEQLNLQTVCLDVNAPSWHEDYHVRWDRTGPGVPAIYLWRAEIPLFGEGQAIGRLTVCGPRDDSSLFEKLQILSKIVETAEQQAASLSPSSKSGRMTAPAGSAPVVASHSAA